MNMPRFTAEASVYQTRGHYRLATGPGHRIVAPENHGVVPQLGRDDLPGASCSKDTVFGNVICVECTSGKCTTYVCDQSGNNCKETVRINPQLIKAFRAPTASSLFRLAT
jgi:hypothetical protein